MPADSRVGAPAAEPTWPADDQRLVVCLRPSPSRGLGYPGGRRCRDSRRARRGKAGDLRRALTHNGRDMADLVNHEQGDDRPPSAFRRAVPVAPFPVYEPGPPPGMDRATVAVLVVVGSAVLLGAWLGLHRPGGADSGGVGGGVAAAGSSATSSPAGVPGGGGDVAGGAPGGDDLAGGAPGGDDHAGRDRGARSGATDLRTGSGASAPRAVRGATPEAEERRAAGRAGDARPGRAGNTHTGRAGDAPAGRTAGPGSGGHARHMAGHDVGTRTRHPAGRDSEARADRAAGPGRNADAGPEAATGLETTPRPSPRAGDPRQPSPTGGRRHSPATGEGQATRRPDTRGTDARGTGTRRPDTRGTDARGTDAEGGRAGVRRPEGARGRRPGEGGLPTGTGRPAPGATPRGTGPGLLHRWCDDNFTTAPLLARACHLYVTP